MALETLVSAPGNAATGSLSQFATPYQSVRRSTEQLCEPLATEDYVVQSMPDASPVKWHVPQFLSTRCALAVHGDSAGSRYS
jgi:hypothetical protein